MLEKLINVKLAIARKKPKCFVYERFQEYMDVYDNLEKEPTIADKIRHRKIFEKYIEYINKPEVKK